jgi:hypothetical protein
MLGSQDANDAVDQLVRSMETLYAMLSEGLIGDAEFVCAHVLLLLQKQYYDTKLKWCCGRLYPEIYVPSCLPKSIALDRIPGLVIKPDNGKVDRNIEIFHLFKEYNLKGVKRYVNESMVHWALGLRPYELMTYIPTPDQVHQMMVEGRRCVTAFIDVINLSTIFKDNYPPFIERDALSFTLHDVKHMEQFVDTRNGGQVLGV